VHDLVTKVIQLWWITRWPVVASDMKSETSGKAAYHHGDLRAALLAAAEKELNDKGVEGFTLRGCAKRAGVSHAAPAHHFKDVNALLTALATAGFERFAASIRQHQTQAKSTPRAQLEAAGLGYIDFAKANPSLFRLMFSSTRPDRGDEALSRAASASFDLLVYAVHGVDGVDPRENREAMLDVAASWAVVHGLAELLLSGRMPFLAAMADDTDQLYAEIAGRVILRR
jgi:AcrR family transcriptional regulator